MYTKNNKTTTLKIDSNYISSELELQALCVLLGGYNKYGRKMSVDNLEKHLTDFQTVLYNVMEEIK